MDMSVWYLVGAILVFFMQCGFAAVEAGFTRAKNAGNIIMKNLHMVGGISGLIGAVLLGARIGKYDGKGRSRAILGHNIPLAAMGTFILWFCWYGFNGAAASDTAQLAQILGSTTIAPAVATVACMLFTWIKNGKPDVGMCLNAPLAGLVGITAGCASLDALGSAVVGLVTGILVVLIVEVVDTRLHIDDPVGAVAVHGGCGLTGTVLTDGGLLYGGGFRQLGVQCLGVLAIAAYTVVTMTIVFQIIKHTNSLRVSAEEEIAGLDSTEHGLPSAYADFMPATTLTAMPGASAFPEPVAARSGKSVDETVPVQVMSQPMPASDVKLSKVTVVCAQAKFEQLKSAMNDIGVTGMTVAQVLGCGIQKGRTEYYRGVPLSMNLLPKLQVDMVVSKVPVAQVVDAARKALYTGHIGDGKIFVYGVEQAVKVRTNERGYDALQGEE